MLSCGRLTSWPVYNTGRVQQQAIPEVWAPILVVGDLAVPFVLQRLNDLQPSNVSTDVKLQEAQDLCDMMAVKLAEPDTRNKSTNKLSESQLLKLS